MTKRSLRRLVFCALAAAAAGLCSTPGRAQSPAPQPSPTTAGEYWYDAAYDHWRALPREHFATYDTDLVYVLSGKRKERKDRVAFRYHDGKCLVVGIPLDKRDRPDKTQITDRCFGPDFSFAFVQQRLGGFKNAPIEIPTVAPTDTPAPHVSGLPEEIGKVKTRTRPYDVTFAGYETKDGKNTVHLTLVALYHPADHLLTDMWIDPATLGVVHLRAVAEANQRVARVTFEAFYDEDAGNQVLTSVKGYVKAQALVAKIGIDFVYQQSNFQYPDTLPDWYFDQTKYDAHQAEVRAAAQQPRAAVPTPTPTPSS